MVMPAKRVVIIGSGNVASHLSRGLYESGCDIIQIYSRVLSHAQRLAVNYNRCEAISSLSSLCPDADLYLISVADAAVSKIASQMHVSGLVAHTSGSVPLQALASSSRCTAVLYPLQTFTRDAYVDLKKAPFFTEASDGETLDVVDGFARLISDHIYHADSAQRKNLHIAGVLSCNFVNYLWDCAAEVLKKDGYDFSVVEPLIRATFDKAVKIGPRNSQTGPAMRCDLDVIRDHIEKLDPQTAGLYVDITRAIISTHNLDCKL